MANKMITLPDELILKLKKEENASGLIQTLLFKHYSKSGETSEEIIEEVKKVMTEEERKEKFEILKAEDRLKEIKNFPEGLKNELGEWIIEPPRIENLKTENGFIRV